MGWRPERPGRLVALMGDAELDEGNIYEALQEGWKNGYCAAAGGSSTTTVNPRRDRS